jgi:hypothetical protein
MRERIYLFPAAGGDDVSKPLDGWSGRRCNSQACSGFC